MKKFLIMLMLGFIFSSGISFAQELSAAPPPNRDAIRQSEEAQRRFNESQKKKPAREMPSPNSAKRN